MSLVPFLAAFLLARGLPPDPSGFVHIPPDASVSSSIWII